MIKIVNSQSFSATYTAQQALNKFAELLEQENWSWITIERSGSDVTKLKVSNNVWLKAGNNGNNDGLIVEHFAGYGSDIIMLTTTASYMFIIADNAAIVYTFYNSAIRAILIGRTVNALTGAQSGGAVMESDGYGLYAYTDSSTATYCHALQVNNTVNTSIANLVEYCPLNGSDYFPDIQQILSKPSGFTQGKAIINEIKHYYLLPNLAVPFSV